MCVSHFFLFFSLIFLFASCPCMLVPGSACPCLHPPAPGFLCLPLPTCTQPHLATPAYLLAQWVWWVVFFLTLFLCSHLQPTCVYVPLPCACTSLCSHLLTCTHLPVPVSCPASTCLLTCTWPYLLWPPLPASAMSLVSSCFSFYFIFVFTFPIHLHPCPCPCACLCSCLPTHT